MNTANMYKCAIWNSDACSYVYIHHILHSGFDSHCAFGRPKGFRRRRADAMSTSSRTRSAPDAVMTYVGRNRSSCGYCAEEEASTSGFNTKRKSKTSVSDGAVAHRLSARAYNDLCDDGWRRSGSWVYKPVIGVTCCAQHTIRLDVGRFKASKSQRKVERRLLAYSTRSRETQEGLGDDDGDGGGTKVRALTIETARSTFIEEEYELWKRYQAAVHGDAPSELRKESYARFLVESPIVAEPPRSDTPSVGYGAFHQQYRMDGRLIAVGVVDILPRCLSSKYFFWDPDYAHLSLGKLSALEEIKFVQKENLRSPEFQYYYMGYYIHTCPKMKYKAEYSPSEIRCSTTNRWVCIDDPEVQRRLNAREDGRLSANDVSERRVCDPARSLVGLMMNGELVTITTMSELATLAQSTLRVSPENWRAFREQQAEFCQRVGPVGESMMNVIDIERDLLFPSTMDSSSSDEDDDEEEEEIDDDES